MKVRITAGPHSYVNCPMIAPIDLPCASNKEYALVDEKGNRLVCQVLSDDSPTKIAWIEPEINPGETKEYRLDEISSHHDSGIEISDLQDGRLEVKIARELFTRYHYGSAWPRPFLYPFVGPKGISVTRHFPMRDDVPGEKHDHPHHRSVYVAYGEVNGTDNWSEAPGHGFIRHVEFEEITGGPVLGRIRARNRWESKDGVPQMEDVREFTIWNLCSERIVDVAIDFIAAYGDVHLGDTKEGGIISVRVATSMDGDRGGMIINSYGARTESENWGRPAHWVDYYGPVEGSVLGITIMDHPSSFRYPTRWHVRDYGLFAANPFALKHYEPDRNWSGEHVIKSGDSLHFQYRIYVHEGDTQQANCTEKYFGFIAPPRVEVV